MTSILEYEQKIQRLESKLARLQQHLENESVTRIHAETALGVAQEQLEVAIDAARLATWRWNLSQRSIHFNQRWSEITEGILMPTEFSDSAWMTDIHPEDLPQLQETLKLVVARKRERFVAQFRYKSLRTAQKPWVWIEMIGVFPTNQAPDLDKCMVGCASDITVRKERVDELKLSRDKAELASQAKTELLAHVSHELRTPLHAVLSMAELLSLNPTALSSQQSEQLAFLSQSAEHVLSLVNDLLDYASFERGHLGNANSSFVPHYQAVNIQYWLKGICEPFKPKAANANLTFEFSARNISDVFAKIDLRRSTQVLNNLLSNAFKFTPKGSVKLTVDYTDEQLHIEITDTGIGISEDKLIDIFKPFTQADQGIQRQYGGTGLGLSICQTICKQLGGSLDVSSTLGHGSVFKVKIPAQRLSDVINTTHTDVVPSNMFAALPSGLTVLVVDDNLVNLKVAQAFCQKLDVKLTCCDSAQQALGLLRSNVFDIALIDLQMPLMSGFELLKNYLSSPSKHAPPKWVASTAHAIADYKEKCLAAGFDGFLSKPFDIKALYEILQQLSPPIKPTHATHLSKAFLQRFGFDIALMKDLSAALNQDIPQRLDAMKTAFASKQFDELQRQAHAIKGALGQLGDDNLPAQIAKIEADPQGTTQASMDELSRSALVAIAEISKVCSTL